MTRARLLIVVMLAVIFSVSVYRTPIGGGGVDSRSIRINGVFVLVDEAEFLGKLKNLSAKNSGRQEFLDEVRLMLNKEPYISSSSIRYSWPDDVVIEITEVSPVAILNEKELLLGDCRVVSKGSNKLSIKLMTFDTAGQGLKQFQCDQVMEILPILNLMLVNHATLLANYILEIKGQRVIVDFESIKESSEDISRIVGFMKKQGVDAEYIDMRYVSGVAIKQVAEL
jgi:cell division septal protein FtsQ